MARRPRREKRPPRVSGAILISLGLLLVLGKNLDIDQAWPLVLILAGVILIVAWAVSGRNRAEEYDSPPPPQAPPPPPPPPVNG